MVRINELRDRYLSLTRAIARASRDLADGPTAAELSLEAEWLLALEPVLAEQYGLAVREIGETDITVGVDALFAYFAARLTPRSAWEELAAVNAAYYRQSYNLGGRMALDELGSPAAFELTDEEILEELAATAVARSRFDADADVSLTRTTARELAHRIASEIDSGVGVTTVLSELGTYVAARSLMRSAFIGENENTLINRRARLETFARNGVEVSIFRTRGDERVCPICEPNEGRRFPTANPPADLIIPLHGRCRCYDEPVRGEIPVSFWVGG